MPLAEIMRRRIKRMSKDELAKMPRDEYGNIVLDEDIVDGGFRVQTCWNEFDGTGIFIGVPKGEELEWHEFFKAMFPDAWARGQQRVKTHQPQSKH
jgi:hypothetical protein